MNIFSTSVNRLELVWAIRVAVQVAPIGSDSRKGPFILKAKLLAPVCREHSNYLKLLFKILSLTSSVSLLKAKSIFACAIYKRISRINLYLVPFSFSWAFFFFF